MKLQQSFYEEKNNVFVKRIFPSKFVEKHNLDPLSVLLLIRSDGFDDLQLKILGEENLSEKEETEKAIPAPTGISL